MVRKDRAAGALRASVTMDDIARLAKVSKPTVSRAFQNSPLVKPQTRQRILEIARQQGYAVNQNASKLRAKRTNSIAVVMHLPAQAPVGAGAPFMFQLLGDVSQGLWIRGQDVLLCAPVSDDVYAYQDLLLSKRADGIIFLGQGAGDGWLRDLGRTDVPFVVWGGVREAPAYCTVGSDNQRGGVLAGRRFESLGRRDILFLGNTSHLEMRQRRDGLAQGLREAGSDARIEDLELADFTFETALDAMGRRLARGERMDAIFAGSDTIAMAAITALRAAGLRTPQDVSVIGYNDMPLAAHFEPPLTTIRQDTRHAGTLLVEKLFQLIDGGRPVSTKLPTELIVRAT